MKRYDPELIKKIAEKTGKNTKYIRERISQRALSHNISPEAELANWARSLRISASTYIRKLSSSVQSQIYSPPQSNNSISPKHSVIKIVQFGKKEDEWYNQWWVQLLIAFFILGILASTISQVLSTWITNSIGLTKP